MGYYATMDGSITLRKPIAQETILERIGDFAYENEPEVTDETDRTVTFRFGGYQRYYDEEIFDFLAEIESATESGEITYFGEDNSLWRHYFDPEQKHWVEQNGYVEYEKAGKTIPAIQDHYAALHMAYGKANNAKRSKQER